MSNSHFISEWVDAAEFRKQMGISRTLQWQLVKSKKLKAGVHFYRTGPSPKSHYRFNLPACIIALKFFTQS